MNQFLFEVFQQIGISVVFVMLVNILVDLLTGVKTIADWHINIQKDDVEIISTVLLFNLLQGYESIISKVYFKVFSKL